jgi:hypothetical protein
MTGYRPWDVVVVPFPFTDKRVTKVRPAVIVSTDSLRIHNQKYVLAMITSAAHTSQVGDVPINDLKSARDCGSFWPSTAHKHLLDTNLPDHFDVRETHHDLLHTVHLQGTHAAFDKSYTNLATRP